MVENEKDKMQGKNSTWKKWTAIAAIGFASVFGGNMQEAEAGSANGKEPPPKEHKQVVSQVSSKSERDEFYNRNRVKADGRRIVRQVNVQHATQEENAKLTELNQRWLDLRQLFKDAKANNDQEKMKTIAIEIMKVDIEKSKVWDSIRARKLAQEGREEER